MPKNLMILILLLHIITVYSQNPCLNKPNGFECGINRSCSNQYCEHKKLFPLSKYDIIFIICLSISTTVSILAGRGTAVIYLALIIYVEGFDFREALPIGTGIIFVQNSIMLIYFSFKKHPVTKKNLILYDLFLLLMPFVLIGNLSGYFVFVILPKIVLQMIFAATIAYFIYLVFAKTYETYLNENEMIEKEKSEKKRLELQREALFSDEKQTLIKDDENQKSENKNSEEILGEGHVIAINYDTVKNSFDAWIFKYLSLMKILSLLFSIFYYFFFMFLQGGIRLKSFAEIEYCSRSYFTVYFAGMLLQLKIGIIITYLLIKESQYSHTTPDVQSGRIKYDIWSCSFIAFLGFSFGLGNISIGISGSSILMHLKYDPIYAVATSVPISQVTIISTMLNYIFNGFLNIEYTLFVSIISLFTTLLGLILLNYLLNRFRRTSILSFTVGCLFIISLIFVMHTTIILFQKKGDKFSFNDFCSLSSYIHRIYDK